MKIIPITDIENIKIGNSEDLIGGTGCTVIICEKGAPTGLDVRGGGPASRESDLLKPTTHANVIHAIVLSGGSAFGLGCADGVMEYLEQKKIGFDVGVTHVPLVCQSCIFDLSVGNVNSRPNKEMGLLACIDSEKNTPKQGCVGAGTGATVGKLLGTETSMKSGLGYYAVQIGDLKVGAVVVVNARGDIYDIETNKILAGLLNKEHTKLINSEEVMYKTYGQIDNSFNSNTTIGVIITNAKFDKTQMNKIASMAHNGYARAINPVHTMTDGDSIYAMSTGDISADINLVGTLSARVMALAIKSAVLNATTMFNLPAANDFIKRL